MMQIVEKNEGTKIQYEESGNRVYFGDGEIMINVEKRQKDYPILVDVCMDRDKNLMIGTGSGLFYIAQIEVPAAEYIYPEISVKDKIGEASEPPIKKAFSMDYVVMTLWSIEDLIEVEVMN